VSASNCLGSDETKTLLVDSPDELQSCFLGNGNEWEGGVVSSGG